jgi:hypothetical protein
LTIIKFKSHFLCSSKSAIQHPTCAPYATTTWRWGSEEDGCLGQDFIRDRFDLEKLVVVDLSSICVSNTIFSLHLVREGEQDDELRSIEKK